MNTPTTMTQAMTISVLLMVCLRVGHWTFFSSLFISFSHLPTRANKMCIRDSAQYDANEAMGLVVETATAKFDETVELHVKLGVDSRHADQQVRGAIVLPHGTGKTQRVLVFAKAAKADEARAAGADYVGEMDLVEKIQKENWFDYDVVVASPDMMGVVGRLGKVPVSYTHLRKGA